MNNKYRIVFFVYITTYAFERQKSSPESKRNLVEIQKEQGAKHIR